MGYTTDERMTRVDIFKENFKWYTTIALRWDRYDPDEDSNYESIIETFKRCCKAQFKNSFAGMFAVCLEPYHKYSYPLMIKL